MRIKLTQPGMESYTGQMGVTFFENGVSTGDVRPQDAIRMAAVMKCEWEDGSSPSVTQSMLDNAGKAQPTFAAENEQRAVEARESTTPVDMEMNFDAGATMGGKVWTEAELSEVADRDGIKGLRSIATPLGVRGSAIKELIAEILQAQAKNAPKPAA